MEVPWLLLRLSEGSSRAACTLHVARERDDGGKKCDHPIGDLSLMCNLGVRINVQVLRKRNNIITCALAANTMNLPVVLAGASN